MRRPLAIVGLACQYPDASSPDELFENVLAGRRAFRRIPDERLPLDQYGELRGADAAANIDRTYVTQAALIEGWEFDRLKFKIVGSTYRSADLTHWLALDVAERALRDAGFADGDGLPRERTGVILGNTLTGEFSRAQVLRLRWPYLRGLLADSLSELLPEANERERFIDGFEARYKAPFEPFGDESLAGGLANTIAGRICNYFDLGGGGFTVDGACSSSLLAVGNACSALESGDLDVALAGGVDLSLDPFELVGFARAGALARDEMRVYDRRPQGFWPGEGCGVVVLMREEDALAQGRAIHARVCGWGISSDGSGGISRPEREGQLRALRRAYERAGFGPETIGYFEGHGTGTGIGDATELAALTQLLAESGVRPGRPTALGSVKANIGHTKAAAGIAGLIKAAVALERQIVPPTPCERPHALVDEAEEALLRVPTRGAAWPHDAALRAGVSSMGFGGINAHVVLDCAERARTTSPSMRERILCRSRQDAELFVLAAGSSGALVDRVRLLRERAAKLSRAELGDLAGALAREIDETNESTFVRAAIVASRPDELATNLDILHDWLLETNLSTPDGTGGAQDIVPRVPRLDVERGVFLASGERAAAIGLLFPGQGAPIHADLGGLADRFEIAHSGEAAKRYEESVASLPTAAAKSRFEPSSPNISARAGKTIVDTAIAQPAIVASSLASAAVLDELGITATLAVGHSIGEIGALQWAGSLSLDDAIALATARGRIMSERARAGGAMASLGTSPAGARALYDDATCTLAAHNGPKRCVVSGDADAVERVIEAARRQRIPATRLDVSHAFHSRHVDACGPALREALASVPLATPKRTVISTRTGNALEAGDDLREHLVAQMTEPVLFADAVTRASRDVDLFIELGPGRMLSSLASEFLDTPIVPLDVGRDSLRTTLAAIGAAFALGAPLRARRLFENRVVKAFDLDHQPHFFANPCSMPATRSGSDPLHAAAIASREDGASDEAERTTLGLLRELVAVRCELPTAAIAESDRFLSDLHLTSIAVSEIATTAVRELGRAPLVAPSEFADATLAELAEAIDSEERSPILSNTTSGVDAWVRPFSLISTPRPRPRASARIERHTNRAHVGVNENDWRCFTADGTAFAEEIAATLRAQAGFDGILVYIGRRDPLENALALMNAARSALESLDSRHFVMVHHGDAGVAIARTLHQEARSLVTRVIEIPEDHPNVCEWIVGEVQAAAAFIEARFDSAGVRSERRLQALSIKDEDADFPLGVDDVLLVTGGGKGIAAECAIGIALDRGSSLALLGRSSPEHDAELRENLERIRAAGIRHHYVSADVGRDASLGPAIETFERELGPITGLLHGAGVNRPAPIGSLDEAELRATLAPKVWGFERLLDRLDASKLRCVVGFGSIIAEIGLPGEAHYAFANELLARATERYAQAHPQVRCLCLEWSIWSGVGMGERLGRVEVLASQNITAITPEEGIGWLKKLMAGTDVPVRVFLSGRFGAPPTLAVEERELPVSRFLERIREYTPGIELVCDAELSLDSDPYLADHVYAGESIVPGVMGLEALAQIAMAIHGQRTSLAIEDVRFLRPTIVPRDRRSIVRIAGLARDDDAIDLALRCDASDFQVNHMTARIRFDASAEGQPIAPLVRDGVPELSAADWPESETTGSKARVPVDPDRELYGDLFFHAGRFRRVAGYRVLGAFGCRAEIEPRQEPFFGAFQPQSMVLGDPGVRDAALHAIQACVPDRDLLPIAATRIEIDTRSAYGESNPAVGSPPHLWVDAIERSRGSGVYVYDVEISTPEGAILERWTGLQLKEVAGASHRDHWPPALLAPRIQELATLYCADDGIEAAVVPGRDRAASELALALASGSNRPVGRRADGKPLLDSDLELSLSHSDEHTLALVARAPIACDMESVEARPVEVWSDLLAPERARLAEHLQRTRGEALDVAATRIWGAIECLKKIGMQRETPITVSSEPGDAMVRLAIGQHTLLSLDVRIDGAERPVVISILARARNVEQEG